MELVLLAHMADVHLGHRQYGLSEREEDVYEAFEEAVRKAAEERVDAVLIAGDIFDSPRPPTSALLRAKRLFNFLSEKGIKVFYVLGDHDTPKRRDELPPTQLFNELIHLGLKNYELKVGSERIVLTGLDKMSVSVVNETMERLRTLSSEALNSSKKSVLLAHVPLDLLQGRSGQLPAGYSYYALGHEHVRLIKRSGGSLAAYPGSLEVLSRAEVEEWYKNGKGFYLVDLSRNETELYTINLESIRPQRIVYTDIDGLDSALQELISWSSSCKKKPITHISVSGKQVSREFVSRSLQRLSNYVLLYRYEIVEQIEKEEFSASSLNMNSLIEEYLKSKGVDEEGTRYALSLYEAFRRGGEEAVEAAINERLSKVMGA